MMAGQVPSGSAQWLADEMDKCMKGGGKEGHMSTLSPAGGKAMTVPALLLVTKGRKSGEKYLFPLFYGESGGSYFVIASKGGAPEHPTWYKNMLVHPDVEIQVGRKTMKAKSHTVPAGPARDALWKNAVASFTP